jgi:hypothetical protein
MSPVGPQVRRRRLVAAVVCAIAAGIGVAAVWRSGRPAAGAGRPLVLIVSGDTAGWLVPCGCTSNQSGGLLRRGSFVRQLGEEADVLLADVGGSPGGTSLYQRAKWEAILKGELAMGVAAHNLGGPEVALGADALRQTQARLGVPFLSANVRDAGGDRLGEPVRLLDRGGQRVAVAGVLSRAYAREGVQVDDPREALLQAVAAVKGRYDSLVVLAYLPEEELWQFAAGLPEADIVVGGPTGQSIAPRSVGPTVLAAATNKGKFLIQLEAARSGRRTAWSGRVVEMGPEFADDPEQVANLRQYLEELARRDFAAEETGLAPLLPAGLPKDYRIAGDRSCVNCHKADCVLCETSKHAHAWETLSRGGQQVDPHCQQCHTTAYGLPGGFRSVRQSPAEVGVRCESCHGPSLAHTREPKTRTAFASRDQCARCHDRENSPQFDYGGYWQRIRHGTKAP